MQWVEQWQKACADAMALWAEAGQSNDWMGSRRR
jgi:hypothetical protein